MKLEHKKVILISMFLLIIPVVLGANIIDTIIGPLGLENIPELYLKYPTFFDAIFYFMFFIGISLASLGKMELFSQSKLVPITVGIILALAMSVFSYKRFSLIGDLGPYALIFVILFCFFFGYRALIGMGTNKLIAFAVIYLVLSAVFMFAISPALAGSRTGSNKTVQALSGNPAVQSIVALGNVASWLILIFALFGMVFKRKNDGPNSSETADLKTYFPQGEAAADKIEDVETDVEKNTTDKGEKELLESMKEDTKLIEDSEVPIAEGKATADALEKEKKAEETKNMNEEQIMNTLEHDSETINSTLNRAGAPNVDAVLPDYIRNYLRRVTQIGEALGQNQKKAINARLELLNSTLENVKKIDDILKKSKKLDNNLAYIEKKVAKDMGQEVLTHIREELKKRYSAMNRSKKAFSDQIAKAKAENNPAQINLIIENQKKTIVEFKKSIQTQEINKSHVENTINIFIKQYVAVVTKTINDIKKIIADQLTFEQDLKKKVGNAYTDAQKYSIYMKRLEGAIEKINGQIAIIQKEESKGQAVVEEIIAECNAGTSDMFLELSNINNHTIRLFQNDVLPLLDDFKRLDIQSAQLGVSINELNKSSLQIQKSYEDLKRAVSYDKTGQSTNIEKILMAINNLSNTATQERQQVINQTISQMDKTKADIQNELGKINQENQHLNDKQRRVMESLDKALATLAKLRINEANKIEQKTEEVNIATAQATQNLEGADKKLENVMFKK